MKQFVIIIRHLKYEEKFATTNNHKTAVKYAIEAILANRGKVVQIQ